MSHFSVPRCCFKLSSCHIFLRHMLLLQSVPKTFQATGHSGQWPAQIYWPEPDLTGPNTWGPNSRIGNVEISQKNYASFLYYDDIIFTSFMSMGPSLF